MKATVIYFSQTGNTRKAARAVLEGLAAGAGAETAMVSLKKARTEDAVNCGLLGIGSPCFSSRAPQPVLDFIASLPDLAGQNSFVLATSGGGPGRVLYEMTEALRRKNARVQGGILVRGECFHPFTAIKGRFPGRPDGRDLARAREFGRSLYERVLEGRPGPAAGSWPGALDPGRGFYDLVAKVNRDDQLRALLKAPEVVREKCTLCRWCLSSCPTRSIVMDPLPRITGDRCLRCYRCYTGCPEQAFTAELWKGNLLAYIFYNTWFERWLGDVKPGEKFY